MLVKVVWSLGSFGDGFYLAPPSTGCSQLVAGMGVCVCDVCVVHLWSVCSVLVSCVCYLILRMCVCLIKALCVCGMLCV